MAASGEQDNLALENLLNQATNPLTKDQDPTVVQAFSEQVNSELEGPQIALRLIAHKTQSPQEREALKALTVLEVCVRNCGSRFHQEIGKFRFLNEVIKVVSPKYLGGYTTERVKARCIELMYGWTKALPHEPKILEAYTMLKKQGIVRTDPKLTDEIEPVPVRERDSIFDEEEKSKALARLLKSRNPEDLQAANRLIKNMVRQDQERTEKKSRRQHELDTVNNNIKLLSEMLGCYSTQSSQSDKEILKELYDSLEKKRPSLFRLASDTDEKEDFALSEILLTNDHVVRVMAQYRRVVEGITDENGVQPPAPASQGTGSSLLDLETLSSNNTMKTNVKRSDVDELHDIFGSVSSSNTTAMGRPGADMDLLDLPATTSAQQQHILGLFNTGPPQTASFLQPSRTGPVSAGPVKDTPAASGKSALDELSEGLLLQSLGNKQHTASFTPPLKPALNQLIQQKSAPPPAPLPASPKPTPPPSKSQPVGATPQPPQYSALSVLAPAPVGSDRGDASLLDLDLPTVPDSALLTDAPQQSIKVPSEVPPKSDVSSPSAGAVATGAPGTAAGAKGQSSGTVVTVEPLTDISIPVESIQPSSQAPHTIYDCNQLRVMIHSSKNRPRPDVSVFLVSAISFNPEPITFFSLHASVPKTMRIKLQSASTNTLAAYNPLQAPPARSQVMLIANPNKEPVRLKYKITYSIENQDFDEDGEIDTLCT